MSRVDPTDAGQKRADERVRAPDGPFQIPWRHFVAGVLEQPDAQEEMVREQEEENDDDGERDVHRVVQPVVAHEEDRHARESDAHQIHEHIRAVDYPNARENNCERGVTREDERVAHIAVLHETRHVQ